MSKRANLLWNVVSVLLVAIFVVGALGVNPDAVQAATIKPCDYHVKSGDTLFLIGQAHGLSLAEIQAANPQIVDPNKIKVDDCINIPTRTSGGSTSGGSASSGAASSDSSTKTTAATTTTARVGRTCGFWGKTKQHKEQWNDWLQGDLMCVDSVVYSKQVGQQKLVEFENQPATQAQPANDSIYNPGKDPDTGKAYCHAFPAPGETDCVWPKAIATKDLGGGKKAEMFVSSLPLDAVIMGVTATATIPENVMAQLYGRIIQIVDGSVTVLGVVGSLTLCLQLTGSDATSFAIPASSAVGFLTGSVISLNAEGGNKLVMMDWAVDRLGELAWVSVNDAYWDSIGLKAKSMTMADTIAGGMYSANGQLMSLLVLSSNVTAATTALTAAQLSYLQAALLHGDQETAADPSDHDPYNAGSTAYKIAKWMIAGAAALQLFMNPRNPKDKCGKWTDPAGNIMRWVWWSFTHESNHQPLGRLLWAFADSKKFGGGYTGKNGNRLSTELTSKMGDGWKWTALPCNQMPAMSEFLAPQ